MPGRKRYGILGGTFDPPHIGHLILAQEAYVRLGLNRVWFVPTGVSPHKLGQLVTPAIHRVAMLERALANDARFDLLTLEIERPGPSYTVDTLRQLRAQWRVEVEIALILGWDMLLFLPQWRDPTGVVASVDEIVAVHRPGADSSDALDDVFARLPDLRGKLRMLSFPQLDISSTEIRERAAQGLPVRYLVSDVVSEYISAQGLYTRDGDAGEIAGGVAQGSSEHSTLEARQEAQR
ncbi:MAG TPA: nicotinate-nucleotide adenylyltransferase [Ktedonobacterales bacterium]|jgi:nicotinate-nucleotide adenylyltransferase